MTFLATQCVVASIPTYPVSNHQPKRCLSQTIPVVKTQQSSFPTTQESRRDSDCECFNLYKELVPYRQAWSWQKSIVKEKKALIERIQDCPDSLFLLQHPPVYTMGTRSSEKFLNFDLKDAPFDVISRSWSV
ncbi:hypothetical protein ABKV19_003006 [Rosa sericea]